MADPLPLNPNADDANQNIPEPEGNQQQFVQQLMQQNTLTDDKKEQIKTLVEMG
jgi:hypothetical protein